MPDGSESLTHTTIHRAFAPLKRFLPHWLWQPIRRCATAILTPVAFSWRSGHFRSSLHGKALAKNGAPLPWYTYPCIDFLAQRDFQKNKILEFGGGGSTLWWASRSSHVITFESDETWFSKLRQEVPENVQLHLVSDADPASCARNVLDTLGEAPGNSFDVVIIDGLYRREMVPIACEFLAAGGTIICDNSEGYGIYEEFHNKGFERVDFFGYAPGVILPHCTSAFFKSPCFLFQPEWPIPHISLPVQIK